MFDFLGGVAREFVPSDADIALRLANLRQHYLAGDYAAQARHAGIVAWEQVEAVAGHLMEVEPGSYPVRYRVAGFPEIGSVGLR